MALSLNRTPAPEALYYSRRRRPPPITITESVNMVAAAGSASATPSSSYLHRPLAPGLTNTTHPSPRRAAATRAAAARSSATNGVSVKRAATVSSVPMRRTLASMGTSRQATPVAGAPMARTATPVVLAVSSISVSASSVTLYRAGGVAMERTPSSYGVDGNPYRPRTLPTVPPVVAAEASSGLSADSFATMSPPATAPLPLSPERCYDTLPARLTSTASPYLRHRHSHTELSRRRRAPLPFDVSRVDPA